MIEFTEHVRYAGKEWIVMEQFMGGNGTYDIQMLRIKNTVSGQEAVVAEMDVEYISPF